MVNAGELFFGRYNDAEGGRMSDRLKFAFLVLLNIVVSVGTTMAILFLPAGSFQFWEGWLYLAVAGIPTFFTYAYFYKYDRPLFERRLQRKEKSREQKLLRRMFLPVGAIGSVLPGLDYRFGWSRTYLGGVPLWLILLSQTLVLGGLVVVFWAMKVNSFASRTIQVETGQTTISSGPYSLVRHPFYTGRLMTVLFTAPALGSYFAWPVLALYILFFVLRLLNEEKALRRELPGYPEYCLRTRFRLLPLIW